MSESNKVTIPLEDDDLKISEMPLRNKLILTDQFPLIAGGKNYRAPLSSIKDLGVPGPGGPVGPVGPMGAIAYYVADIPAMKALPKLAPGHIIYVGKRADQFIVVDDASLGSDGGTVFIPNSVLSPSYDNVIPGTYFSTAYPGGDPAGSAKFLALDHSGIDFESVELILSDAGEKVNIWGLHGHVCNIYADRVNAPQQPNVDTGLGRFYDPGGAWTTVNKGATHPLGKTGGCVLRYKYATSGLRIKRVTGKVFELTWWPVVAVDDETGPQVDNSGKICWCMNAAAKAGAEMVYIDKFYHYTTVVEVPNGVELRGRGPGVSGFRVTDRAAYREMLLSVSSLPATPSKEYKYPTLTPVNRLWSYWGSNLANVPTFFPATGSTRMKLSELEWDGNVENNMDIWRYKGPAGPGPDAGPSGGPNGFYAYGRFMLDFYASNTPTYAGYATTNHGGRVIGDGTNNSQVCYVHNVKFHGYGHTFLGNDHTNYIGTGLLEVGNCLIGHWFYLCKGTYENLKFFGYTFGDGVRGDRLEAKSVEMIPYPHPQTMFELNINSYPGNPATGTPEVPGAPVGDTYAPRTMWLFSHADWAPQFATERRGYPYPDLGPYRVSIDHLNIDATKLDNWPGGVDGPYPHEPCIPFLMLTDNFHVRSARIKFGRILRPGFGSSIFATQGNVQGGNTSRNVNFENAVIEYGHRGGIQFFTTHQIDAGWTNMTFKNVTIEPDAATHVHNDPGPSGINYTLGSWSFKDQHAFFEPFDGIRIDFTLMPIDSTLNGKYIDIKPPETTAPTYRFWFNYNTAGSAPSSTGVTLQEVPVPTGSTAATVAAKVADLISGTRTVLGPAASYLTSATFGNTCVVGSISSYRHEQDFVPNTFPPTPIGQGSLVAVTLAHAHHHGVAGAILKGYTKDAASLALIAASTTSPPVLDDAYIVIYPTPLAWPLPAQHIWKYNGSSFVDLGVYSGVVAYPRSHRRNHQPAWINFERFSSPEPTAIGLMQFAEIAPGREVHFTFKECALGTYHQPGIFLSGSGDFSNTAVNAIKDNLFLDWDACVLDLRDVTAFIWSSLDLFLYCSKFRSCRFRTPRVATGLTSMGPGYEVLLSEQSGMFTGTAATAGATGIVDIQTKLFWLPKDGNVRIYPADAATAAVFNTNMPAVTWLKSHIQGGPVGVPTALGGSGAYYTVNEDRRAPLLRLIFATVPSGTLNIGWAAAVSP